MKSYRVTFSALARAQLVDIYRASRNLFGADVAYRHVSIIRRRCEGLARVAIRGTPLDHLLPGLRSMPVGRRATVLFRVSGDEVVVLAVRPRGVDIDRYVRRSLARPDDR